MKELSALQALFATGISMSGGMVNGHGIEKLKRGWGERLSG